MVALTCCLVPSAYAASGTDTSNTSNTTTSTRKLRSGAVLEFSSDAKYELGDTVELQLAPTGASKTPVQVLKLSAGRVSVRIAEPKNPKQPTHAVMIEGPRKVSAIAKGGESVVIIANERVTIAAINGEMLTAFGNSWKPLASGLVRSQKSGRTRICSIEPKALQAAERWIAQRRSIWERRLDRLERYLTESKAKA